jgi:hypothetical protein
MTNTTTPTLLVGGIPIVWLVVLSCALIVIGVCALTYPIILLNRWRMREKTRDEEDDEEEEYEEPKKRSKGRGGGLGAIFGAGGRPSTRGKWVERIDPQSGQPYYEHTGTGEVTWTDPRPQKMRNQKQVANGGNLVVASMSASPMMPNMGMGGGFGTPAGGPSYGVPGGFGGGPRPGMPPQGMMPPQGGMLPHTGSMGNMMPPPMAGPMGSMPRMNPQAFAGNPPAMPPPGNAPPGMPPPPNVRRTQGPGPGAPAPAAPAAPAADPKFEKYSRMQKAGLPEGAIRNAMNRDGLSEAEQKAFLGS